MRAARVLCAGLLALATTAPTLHAQDEPPYPAGMTSQTLEGLKCAVAMPNPFDPKKEHSLVVVLHGLGGTETGVAQGLEFLCAQDYVVVAPKAVGDGWTPADLERVKKIVAGMKTKLRVGANRLHGLGFSNGGWNLAPLVFDDALHFTSACWVAAGCKSPGKLPKHAKKEMGVLALAGGDDPNRESAEATVNVLEGDVRWVGARIQSGLGHAWPDKLMPFYGWWLGVQEGRFVPGDTQAFEWQPDAVAARLNAVVLGRGAFEVWHGTEDAASPVAREFQNVTCLDPAVQFFGRQLVAIERDRTGESDAFAAAGLKETPAVVVFGEDGRPRKVLQGKISAKAFADALRSVAAVKTAPK